jgi:hypothetical protein
MTFNQIFLLVLVLLAPAIIIVGGLIFIRRVKNRGRITRALNMSLFLISLPKKVKKEESEAPKSAKEIISAMEQLYSSFSNIKETKDVFIYGQPHLVFEIATPEQGEEIAFYLALPSRYESVVEKQIHGFYPEASISKAEDYNIFNAQGASAGAYLKLAKTYHLPFKTYQELETDPLNEIANTLSKLKETGEGAAIQIAFRPTLSSWQKQSHEIAKEMQRGKSFYQARSAVGGNALSKIIKSLKRGSKSFQKKEQELENKNSAITPGQEEVIRAIDNKASKAGYDVNVRLLVSADSQERADQLLGHLEGAFTQFSSANLNQLKSVRIKRRALKKLIYNFSFRLFNRNQKMLLGTEELTSLFHFPTSSIETPNVKFLKAKSAAPPASMPKHGIVLGRNLYRGVETKIYAQDSDRRRHLYVIGQTGTGKSVFLGNLVIQDIQKGHGVGLLDPHGDLVERILRVIPEERTKDVMVLNPADLERPLGLNMLDYDVNYPEQKTFAVNELMSIFDKLYDLKQTGGPMFEQYTRNALLLLMDDPSKKFTLMEVPKVMADAEFRKRLLTKCQNIVVRDFWEKEAEKAGGEAALQNIVPYITSKFNVFIANDYMRPIIGQSETSLNFRQIMDERKILLVNLSKGRLGDINSALLGLIVTGKILMASFSRVDLPEEERNDFYLYMDEFQNFATNSIATILSEARKYHLCLTIAHQFIGQLTEEIQKAVFGNVGSMASFRVGAEDAEFLVKQFEPVFNKQDLINVDNFNAYIKLMVNNETSQPFNLMTEPPEQGNSENSRVIKELSRLEYGREKSLVDHEIAERWKLATPPVATSTSASSDMEVK